MKTFVHQQHNSFVGIDSWLIHKTCVAMALHHILLHQVEYSSHFVNWSVMIKSLQESIKRNMFCHTTSYYHLCAVSLVISIACLLCTWHIKFNSEVSAPKKQHLIIFMRALLTTIIGQCQVKALNTKLAIVVATRV